MKSKKNISLSKARIVELEEIARQIRIEVLKILTRAGSGHTGGSLSIIEILVFLYFAKLRHNPQNPTWPARDRFVLSKGHGAPALYAILARIGYFDGEELQKLRTLNGILQGHPSNITTPGIEISTGSLGQGLSVACGMALASRLDNAKWRVYVLMGDGEIQEGQIWEACMAAAHYKLDNLCCLIDANKLQIDGPVSDIMNVEPLKKKGESFGWRVFEADGHDFQSLSFAFDQCARVKGAPSMIIAHTIKGKGVSFMQGKVAYHGVAPTADELKRALLELRYD
ncbi:MAG: transketolase [bacterium]